MTRFTPFVAVVALALAQLVGASAAAERPITQASSGKTFRVAKGRSLTLRLSNRWRWTTPRSSTLAVNLTPTEYFVNPGFREWKIDARARGRATIKAVGRPTCSDCARATRRFRVTIVVGAG